VVKQTRALTPKFEKGERMCPDQREPDLESPETWELWELVHEHGGSELTYFRESNERARRALEPTAKLIWTVVASGYDDAMQKRNDFLGWGAYKPIP
jgi:hypothetical protein